MAFSVNTNPGALLALQGLSQTNRDLATTQNRISTGLNVASVRDDSSTFIIAQNQRADLAGINAARASLDRASSTLDVAIDAGEAVSDLLIQAREIAVAVQDTGLDTASRAALNNDFQSIVSQIDSIVGQAEFNGTNLISANPENVSAVTGINRAGEISRISVAGVDLRSNSTAATLNQATFTLADSGFTDLSELNGTSSEQQAILAALRNAGDDLGAIVEAQDGTLSIDVSVAVQTAGGALGGTDDVFSITFGGGAVSFDTAAGDGLVATNRDAANDFVNITGTLELRGAEGAFGSAAIAGLTPGTATTTLQSIDLTTDAGRNAAVAVVDAFANNLNNALASFGSSSQQIELQSTFASNLADSIEVGIGNLVDADLARESARLQALQVQQQLGLAAAGIANQAPGAILSLF